jgi:hypothetical protein
MVKVTLDIFSGMPNPSWVLSEKDTKELVKRFAGKAMPSIDAVEGVLGFRSFVIESESDDDTMIRKLPGAFRIGGILSEKFTAREGLALPSLAIDESDEAAHWLLTTAGKAIDEELIQHVESVVQTREKAMGQATEEAVQVEEGAAKSTEKDVRAPCVIQNTAYNPGFWNVPGVQPYNNCYNYAMNYRSDTFAQPGRISGHPNSIMQCANVRKAADWDGCKAICSGRNKNVALVVWPGYDYHWYRKHSNGFWGHKIGGSPARNTDNCGIIINGTTFTPMNCCRGNYKTFCAYLYSPTGMKVK